MTTIIECSPETNKIVLSGWLRNRKVEKVTKEGKVVTVFLQ